MQNLHYKNLVYLINSQTFPAKAEVGASRDKIEHHFVFWQHFFKYRDRYQFRSKVFGHGGSSSAFQQMG
ncbi:hypothetical protein SUGI_0213930 [Cryptomeria japonica]|nr:hypothetical protein SUGI_0213930 [Cryptomeria japonica]